MIMDGIYITATTLINFWSFINPPNNFLWGLLLGASLSIVVNLKVLQGGMKEFMKEVAISGHEKLRKEAQEQFRNRSVTNRAVSTLVSLDRNDITLADLVMLDKLQSEGGLNPMTVQILDGIREAVLEDVEGRLVGYYH